VPIRWTHQRLPRFKVRLSRVPPEEQLTLCAHACINLHALPEDGWRHMQWFDWNTPARVGAYPEGVVS